jgi:RHS repeat-associated protein
LGRLVETAQGSTYTQFVFSPAGTKLAVMQGGALLKATIQLPGGATAEYNASGLNFIRHTDWLGSSRLATTWAHAVYSKEAYAPFGETYNEAGTADRSFTGQDQDTVTGSGATGIYDFLFRKFDPAAGRWLSPDPYGWNAVSLNDPQSLNRYAYVENQPENEVDAYGLDDIQTSDDCPDKSMPCYFMKVNASTSNWDFLKNTQLVEPPPFDCSSDSACSSWAPTGPNIQTAPQGVSNLPISYGQLQAKSMHCLGVVAQKNGVSIALDVLGAIPGLGNLVSGGAAAAGAGWGFYQGATGKPGADTAVGLTSTSVGIGLTLADATLQGAIKTIPVAGNIVSGLTGLYDIYQGSLTYSTCMAQ